MTALINNDQELAFAKINLALHILGRREDGYHEIDTIFAFMDRGDILSVQISNEISIDINGPFAKSIDCGDDDNLAMRAAHMMQLHYDVRHGAALTLIKNLPVASGIGGGSADAAATARLLNRHWGLNRSAQELSALLSPLGADIAACIYSKTCRGQGIGTDIEFLDDLRIEKIPILLINPMIAVSTGPIFAAWDGQFGKGLGDISLNMIENHYQNDMQRAAISLFPVIDDVLYALGANGPIIHRMSGSGATCFALYENISQRDAAYGAILSQYPDWWYMTGFLK